MNWQGALDYVTCLNANNYLGYSDWRLPNGKELGSVIDRSQINPSLPLGHPFSNVQEYTYWSSTSIGTTKDSARTFNLSSGSAINNLSKNLTNYVWPIRAGLPGSSISSSILLPQTGQTTCYDAQGIEIPCAGTSQDGEIQAGVEWPSQRTTDNGDQTITDNLTGLMWAQDLSVPTVGTCIGGAMNWQAALDYITCLNGSNYLGHNDWRLPNLIESTSLFNNYMSPSLWLPLQGFLNYQIGFYWTATTMAASLSNAWITSIDTGGLFRNNVKIDGSNYIWPVRTGFSGIIDDCPLDPFKITPGSCGCGIADTDTDGDGTADCNDAFPADPAETIDTDGDGVGDNADAFPTDPTETTDTDGDGQGDNSDPFPNDPNNGAGSTKVPVHNGLWLIPSIMAGLYLLRRRKRLPV